MNVMHEQAQPKMPASTDGCQHPVANDSVVVEYKDWCSCQLRYGIEHVFRTEPNPLEIIFQSVGFSYSTDFPDNAIADRVPPSA